MWFLDSALKSAYSEIIGSEPEFYCFGLESWRMVYAGKTAVMTGVPRMLAWHKNTLYMMQTSDWTTAKWFPDKVKSIPFDQIKSANKSRFFFAHFLTLELTSGEMLRLVVNPWLYWRLHGQREGIRRLEEKLAQKKR